MLWEACATDGGRSSPEEVQRAHEVLARLSKLLQNPVEIAKENGLTKKKNWHSSEEYQEIAVKADRHNADIIKQMSEAQLPPDIIADYFDSKITEGSKTQDPLKAPSAEEKSEMEMNSGFWLGIRFKVRAKEIAVADRDEGTGGFGSGMMKDWGARWIYGPNADDSGQTIGTRTVFVLEGPASSPARPQ